MFPKTSIKILKTIHFQNRLDLWKSVNKKLDENVSPASNSRVANSAGTSRGIRSVLRPSLVAGTEGRKRVEHKCTRIVDVRCVARALTCLEIHPFFSAFSLSGAGWPGEGGRGDERGPAGLESEYGIQEQHAQVHGFAESGTKSIARTYAVVYAYTRTRTAAPRGLCHRGRKGRREGEAFNFSCCLRDQPEAEILAEEYAPSMGVA